MNKEVNSVESKKNGLVATTYIKDSKKMISSKEDDKADSFEVYILKRLRKVATLDETDKVVTTEYVIGKLGLEGKEAEQVKSSSIFDTCRIMVKEIDEKILEWNFDDEVTDCKFKGESKTMELHEKRSNIAVDVTKGMVCILPMINWGEEGGVYATKLVSDTEKRTVIKLVLKYKAELEDEYSFSEFLTVKLSELFYRYEGADALVKNIGKLKKLMDYTPAGMEVLNYEILYLSLCRFQNRIIPRVVSSDKLNLNDTYELLVKEVYELVDKGWKGIIGKDTYTLRDSEIESIAKKAGYQLKELTSLLKDSGLLDTDKDKKSRRQKTTTRDGHKGKYYCILTSERFIEQCDQKADKLSLTEDEYNECEEIYSIIKGENTLQLEEKKENKGKEKRNKKKVGMLDIDAYLAQF